VWTYSLRGELPPSKDYKEGLKQLILTHNSFSDIIASELVMALRNDVYMRSVDLRCNLVSERWVIEFAKLLRTNRSLTNVDLRENVGLTSKHHRNIALSLLSNIQSLRESGELEEDNETSMDGATDNDSLEIRSKFVKTSVLTIEIPKKCKSLSR
jgi:hypothetical protein